MKKVSDFKLKNLKFHLVHYNIYGEQMILAIDGDRLLFFHSDCNEDFEDISDLRKDPTGFKYILNMEEKIVIKNFMEIALAISER